MRTQWLDDEQLATWVRLAAVVELLPGVLDTQLRRDADLTHFEYHRRATNASLTYAGRDKVVASPPGHVANVRHHVVDALTPQQLAELGRISDALLERLDPRAS